MIIAFKFISENYVFIVVIKFHIAIGSKRETAFSITWWNVFEIQVIYLEDDKKPVGIDNICYNDQLLYEPAEQLYLEIDHGRLQDDEKNMDDVLKELK